MKHLLLRSILLIVLSATSAGAGAAVDYHQEQLEVSAGGNVVSYGDLPQVTVGLDLLLPVERVSITLQPDESPGDLNWTTTSVKLQQLSAVHYLADVPTSDQPSETPAPPSELGHSPVAIDGLTGDGRLSILVFPVSVSPDDVPLFNQSIQLRIADRKIIPDRMEARVDASPFALAVTEFPTDDIGARYLIVTNEELRPAMEELKSYRRSMGIDAWIEDIEDILSTYTSGDNAERLRNRLQDFYQDGGVYVLLAGDETVLPVRYAYPGNVNGTLDIASQQLCDLYFADMTGDWDADGDGVQGERTDDAPDLVPELRVGRLPISEPWEAEVYIEKLITYETDPGRGDTDWLNRSYFFSSDQMRDYSGGGQHGRISAAFPDHIEIDTASGLEQASGIDAQPTNSTAVNLVDSLRIGAGIWNVLSHGRSDAFGIRTSGYNQWPKSYLMSEPDGSSHGGFSSLAGTGQAAFWYSLACDNGAFDKDQPPFDITNRNVVQDLLTIDDGGAVAMVAYSRWGWVSSSHRLQKCFFDSLYAHPGRPAVDAMYASKAVYSFNRDLVYGQNFHGDPAMRVHTDIPEKLSLTVGIEPAGMYACASCDGQPVSGCQVVVVGSNDSAVTLGVTDGRGKIGLTDRLVMGETYTATARKTGWTIAQCSFMPSMLTDVKEDPDVIPNRFELHQNYPNPFNPSTTIAFDLDRSSQVTLRVYDLLGREVATLIDDDLPVGRHEVRWHGRTGEDQQVASGVYFYRLTGSSGSTTRKMMLLK